jgi:hypothetical protein
MRHTHPVTLARATEDPEALQRFRELFIFRVLVAATAVFLRK